MPNRLVNRQMLISAALAGLILLGLTTVSMADDFSTLFTTPQERRLIDSNRYRVEEQPERVEIVVVEEDEPAPQPVMMAEISSEYRISGITLSDDGTHSVWVNELIYESGDTLDDGSTVQVISGREVKARITTPDGESYLAPAGETIQATYRIPVVEQ